MKKEYQDPEELFKQALPKLQTLELVCPECEEPIHGEDINIHHGLAQCSQCGNSFLMQDWNPERNKPEVPMPTGVEVLRLSNELDIEVSWRRSLNAALIFFTLFWNAIVFFFAIGMVLSGQFAALIFLSIHLFVGISLIYYNLTLVFNRTNIIVHRNRLIIEHRPLKLPFYPERNLPVEDIQQIFVERYTQSTSNGVPNYAFAVSAILKNNKRIKLLKHIGHIDQAQYIEQELEHFLQIEDQKVLGEWGGELLNR